MNLDQEDGARSGGGKRERLGWEKDVEGIKKLERHHQNQGMGEALGKNWRGAGKYPKGGG